MSKGASNLVSLLSTVARFKLVVKDDLVVLNRGNFCSHCGLSIIRFKNLHSAKRYMLFGLCQFCQDDKRIMKGIMKMYV